MSSPPLPEFCRTLQLGQGNLDSAELAECHGLMCGLLCRDADNSVADFMQELARMQLVVEPEAALTSALLEAWESTGHQLADEELGFTLWLPEDDEPLAERTVALARWCSGFLAGLAGGGELDALSEDAREAIADLQQIARAELFASPPCAEDQEEDEDAFAEIVEYVRVAALMMREDFRGPRQDEAVH